VQARGAGLLQAKFEALKRKLEAEGLFDSARKRPLPKFPRRIGIVTSPSGAAIRDILNVLQRRAPHVHVLINPVRVQGTGAATEIAVAIRELNELGSAVAHASGLRPPSTHASGLESPNTQAGGMCHVDLILLARGGGSIEDLWEFNEEIVARAIFHSQVPVVSAVGHEIDFTIADLVADLRAPTPSAAAELIVPDAAKVNSRIAELATCLERYTKKCVEEYRGRLRFLSERTLARELLTRMREAQQRIDMHSENLRRHLERIINHVRLALAHSAQVIRSGNPARHLENCRARFVELGRRFAAVPTQQLYRARERFVHAEALLRLLGPDATLSRGYTITMHSDGRLLRSAQEASIGAQLRTRMCDGEITSRVETGQKTTGTSKHQADRPG
jgi:exodeoxyribonuclease VII large subunit